MVRRVAIRNDQGDLVNSGVALDVGELDFEPDIVFLLGRVVMFALGIRVGAFPLGEDVLREPEKDLAL